MGLGLGFGFWGLHFGPGVTIDLWCKFGVPSGIVAWILGSIGGGGAGAGAGGAHVDNSGTSSLGVSEFNQLFVYHILCVPP